MRRYLIVANQTLLADPLLETVRGCLAAGPCSLYLVVPATHVAEHMVWTEGHDRAVAQQRLTEALERFGALGADVDGEVGDASAVGAVGDVLLRQQVDEVIVSTLPLGVSRWLRQDVPHRIQRRFHLPTTVVTAQAAA